MVVVIINPIAGGIGVASARERVAQASAAVALGGELADVVVSEQPGHAHEIARAAVKKGARLVVAWGGDGTMNEVASALVFKDAALGLVPAGSGNGLARDLGISFNPGQAIREAMGAKPRVIDSGELGGRRFFNIAGVGFDAHIAECLARDGSGKRGLKTYVKIAFRELWSYEARHYKVDGQPLGRPAVFVTLANSPQFGNGVQIAPSARVDDGRLDLVTVEESSRLRTLLAVPSALAGGIERLRAASFSQIDHVSISSDRPMMFHVDGESVRGGTTVEGRVVPASLRVCVR